MTNINLTEIRKQIDLIDTQIIALLNQRWALSPFIKEAKEGTETQILDPEREQKIIRQLQSLTPKTPDDVIQKIWKEIMDESKRRQQEGKYKV